ncbi:hypothetical protein FA95DRAFT_1580837 [Auriscalpium vulgare]|uniref:Uncharacterized protein n=1 Tax=Auriscalpium vulgare TaxID=40419 RepID=A0ACB8S5L6_9AGAM|nr:hypothetical protein FA95DRAFT_1580837 [Auriscalpium vulgare]
MPPRPRPRPANRSTASTASTSSRALENQKSEREVELDKEDVFFMRNRNRTAKDWKKLETREKGQSAALPILLCGLKDRVELDNPVALGSSDVEEGGSTPRKKRPKMGRRGETKDSNGMPTWTRQDSAPLLSDDDDDDLEIIEGYSLAEDGPDGDRAAGHARQKRARSRSRSITPPPKLTMQARQNARNRVRQALEVVPRAPSPTFGLPDDSADIVLDPELASIARDARKHAQHDVAQSADTGGGPEDVTIKVTWRPHPQNAEGKTESWAFRMKRHDQFSVVVDEVADLAGVLAEALVLSLEGSRVFASATPHSLRIWAEAELDASDRMTYEYLREHRHVRPAHAAEAHRDTRSPSVTGAGDDSEAEVQSVQDADDDDDTFKLILRSASTKDVTVTVRPTTTCGAVVTAFLRRTGLMDSNPESKGAKKKASSASGPRLMIDGERMDPATPISEADLEDGDQVEVVGL